MGSQPAIGQITWRDLTVPNAQEVRDFYSGVVGWDWSGQNMGGYDDFNMLSPETGETVAGICHARGSNAHLPPQWLVYLSWPFGFLGRHSLLVYVLHQPVLLAVLFGLRALGMI